jgi:hypothetical protein
MKSTSRATTTKAANSDHIRGLPMDSMDALSKVRPALARRGLRSKVPEWSG